MLTCEAPPEIVFDHPTLNDDLKWRWAICDPSACWGEIDHGWSYDKDVAIRDSKAALRKAWIERGLVDPFGE